MEDVENKSELKQEQPDELQDAFFDLEIKENNGFI